MEFQKFSNNIIIILVFVLAIGMFTLTASSDNQASVSIGNNTAISNSLNNLTSTLTGFQTDIQSNYQAFSQDKGILSFGTLIFNTVANFGKAIPQTLLGGLDAVFTIITSGFVGGNVMLIILLGVMIGGLFIITVAVIWRLVKIGL